jgi:hypothetical protein
MATLQVRSIDDGLYRALGKEAERENRSISQEVISILKKYLSNPDNYDTNMTDEFLKLSGSWQDDRNADEIIADIHSTRNFSSERLNEAL